MGITKAEGFLSMLKAWTAVRKTDGLCQGNVYGSYVHGIFDSEEVLKTIIKALYNKKVLNTMKP